VGGRTCGLPVSAGHQQAACQTHIIDGLLWVEFAADHPCHHTEGDLLHQAGRADLLRGGVIGAGHLIITFIVSVVVAALLIAVVSHPSNRRYIYGRRRRVLR